MSQAFRFGGSNLSKVCEALNIPPCLSYRGCTGIGKIVNTVCVLAKELDVDIPQLPIAVPAPEYMEQKAVADGFTAVSLGMFVHLSPVPPVGGSRLVSSILTEEVENLTGGRVYLETDPLKAAEGIDQHILLKREGLNIRSELFVR